MRVSIQDRNALLAISPAGLSAYARNLGWSQQGHYRKHSNIYCSDTLPEIIVPSTKQLGDYASTVAALIQIFAEVTERDELIVYRSLVTADCDVIRIRVAEGEDGSLRLDDGVKLVSGAHDMVLSAACSLGISRSVYRSGAHQEAKELVRQIRLGQTDQGSFTLNLLTPTLPPPFPSLFDDPDDNNAPLARKTTKRLLEGLCALQQGTEQAASGQDENFAETVKFGVSANLCEALVKIVEPFPKLDISVLWALTRPAKIADEVVCFTNEEAAILKQAAQSLRDQAPRPDVSLTGYVRLLKRGEQETDGTISLWAEIDGKMQSVATVLDKSDYEHALKAHSDQVPVILQGDLERVGQRWRLLGSRVESILCDEG